MEPLILYIFQYLFIPFFPGEVQGTFNQRKMGIGLGKITQQALGLEIDILTEESQVIAIPQHPFKPYPRAFFLSDPEKAVDKPESANGKRGGGKAKVVFILVAEK